MEDTNLTAHKEQHTDGEPLVLLVVPPFFGIRCPALGVSQLKANLEAQGYPTEVLYLNLRFAERVTPLVYEWLSGTGKYLLGEFIFSHALFERPKDDLRSYMDKVLVSSEYAQGLVQLFPQMSLHDARLRLVKQAIEFVQKEAIEHILGRDPWMVGFSSTFESNCSSLALTQEIKRRRPEIFTVIGGANCESDSIP